MNFHEPGAVAVGELDELGRECARARREVRAGFGRLVEQVREWDLPVWPDALEVVS